MCLSVGEALGLYISQDSLEGAEAIEKRMYACMSVIINGGVLISLHGWKLDSSAMDICSCKGQEPGSCLVQENNATEQTVMQPHQEAGGSNAVPAVGWREQCSPSSRLKGVGSIVTPAQQEAEGSKAAPAEG